MFKTIVVGTDGSAGASKAVLGGGRARGRPSPSAVLHIVTVQKPLSPTAMAAGEMAAAAPGRRRGAAGRTRSSASSTRRSRRAADTAGARRRAPASRPTPASAARPRCSATWPPTSRPTSSSSATGACRAAGASSAACPTRCRTTRRAACSSSTPSSSRVRRRRSTDAPDASSPRPTRAWRRARVLPRSRCRSSSLLAHRSPARTSRAWCPHFGGIDEPAHFYRSYQISTGQLLPAEVRRRASSAARASRST